MTVPCARRTLEAADSTSPPTEEGLSEDQLAPREINERTNESRDDADNQYWKVGGVIGYWFFLFSLFFFFLIMSLEFFPLLAKRMDN